MSCASAGNCTAGGYYVGPGGRYQALVLTERNGVWKQAVEDPGTATLNAGDMAQVLGISCTSPGNCGLVGYYRGAGGFIQAFVQIQRNGTLDKAIKAPGWAGLNLGGDAGLNSVYCVGSLRCTAGGFAEGMSEHVAARVGLG